MPNPNLYKSADLMLSKVITDVYLWSEGTGWTGPGVNFGLIEKAAVKLKAAPKIVEMIDGSQYQLGYDFSFEITSLQYYSLYQFEKFKNLVCTFALNGIQTYIKSIPVTIELDAEPGSVKGVIKISGKKFVEKIRDVVDGNPWGSLSYPWVRDGVSVDTLPIGEFTPTLKHGYTYILREHDPLILNILPNPIVTTITSCDLVLVDKNHNPINEAVHEVTIKAFIGGGWITTEANPAFEQVNGLWVAKYSHEGTPLGTSVRVEYTLRSEA